MTTPDPIRSGDGVARRPDLRRHPREDRPDPAGADRHPPDADDRGAEPHPGARRAPDLRQARRPHRRRAGRQQAPQPRVPPGAHDGRESPTSSSSGSTSSRTRRARRSGACNRLGLRTVLVLEGARPREVQGNLLVDYLLGAEIHFAPDRAEQRRMLDRLAEDCRQRGERPHILNDNPMFDVASAIAYLETTMEMIEQLRAAGTAPTVLYMSSSGKGQAGLELARKLWGGFRVHGVTATREYDVPARTAAIANETAATLGLDVRVRPEEVVNFDGFVGAGLRPPESGGQRGGPAVRAHRGPRPRPGLHRQVRGRPDRPRPRRAASPRRDTAVFVHTGGAPAIFTWSHLWTDEGADAADRTVLSHPPRGGPHESPDGPRRSCPPPPHRRSTLGSPPSPRPGDGRRDPDLRPERRGDRARSGAGRVRRPIRPATRSPTASTTGWSTSTRT